MPKGGFLPGKLVKTATYKHWTVVIRGDHPQETTSLHERVFREIGRRLKGIACGWSDAAVTNLSKIILIKQYTQKTNGSNTGERNRALRFISTFISRSSKLTFAQTFERYQGGI